MNPTPSSGPYPSTMATQAMADQPAQDMAAGGRRVAPSAAGTSPVDAELVRRMQAGDERALSAFYDRWFPVVNCLVTRIVKSPDDGEDVVEETFWQAWRQSSRFDPERGSVQTWLLTIARSRALDRLRALKRVREESSDALALEDAAASSASADEPFVPSPSDPSLAVEHQERKAVVLAALAELPREQREALELGYFRGLSQSEIAERTGQPLGTVKTRMRLAMHKLRDRLAVLNEGQR